MCKNEEMAQRHPYHVINDVFCTTMCSYDTRKQDDHCWNEIYMNMLLIYQYGKKTDLLATSRYIFIS